MDAKLTLKLDRDVIERAEAYAQKRQQSLSALVESYLRFIAQREEDSSHLEVSPTVRELSGIIQLDEETELSEIYADYLLDEKS